jgi:hypothetical protein
MEMTKITIENWQIARLNEGNLLAFISPGAMPPTSENEDLILTYSLIVSDQEYIEVSEKLFTDLNSALNEINMRFGHWELKNLSSLKSGSGCDSCAAH